MVPDSVQGRKIMRASPSMTDWLEARAALPGLLSEIAFGDAPPRPSIERAALALTDPAIRHRRRR